MDDGVVHTGNDTEHVGYESEMGPRNEPRLAKFGAIDVLARKLAQIGETSCEANQDRGSTGGCSRP
jgi:hypothetical protein